MKPSRVVAAISLTLGLLSAPAAATPAYPGAGDPADALSCFSDCGGPTPATATLSCYCDNQCETRGDCCADHLEFCAPETVKPACAVTSNTGFSNFCGTDLGFVYQHGAVNEVLFGDTWEKPNGTLPCHDPGEDFVSTDDSQGTLPLARPPTNQGVPIRASSAPATPGGDCATFLALDHPSTSPYTFSRVQLHSTTGANLNMIPGDTPLAGFSDGTNAWGVFKQGYPVPHVYIAYRESSARTNYKVRVDLGNDSAFLNPSVARITSYSDANPTTASNFDTPTTGGVMLMFGRPKFWSGDSESTADNGVYLAKQALPLTTTGASNWAPKYLSAVTNGVPQWTSNPFFAIPIPELQQDFKVSEQIDIKWVPQMKKWVMLYGGDLEWYLAPPVNDQPRHGAIHMRMADYPWGPWTRPTPVLWRESLGSYIKCDASDLTTPAGCDWEVYDPGTWKHATPSTVTGCTTGLPEPVQPNGFGLLQCGYGPFYNPNQRGEMYAANLIPSWTNDGSWDGTSRTKLTTLYFLVSTWTPYQVIVAVADLRYTVQEYATTVKVQLRDLNKKMLKLNTSTPSTTAGGQDFGGPTSWYVLYATSLTQPARGPRIGDTVALVSGQAGVPVKYLAHDTTNNISFTTYTAGVLPPVSAQWKIESTDLAGYPDQTPIVIGKTPFRLVAVGTASPVRRLRSQSNVFHVADMTPADSVLKFSWGCNLGDTCQ